MDNAERSIWVTFSKEGVHMYPGADTDPKLATGDWDDVSFLGIPHRHIFHFKVRIEVFHNDRDIEFIQFKRWMQRLYDVEGVLELNHKSCEMISDGCPGRNRVRRSPSACSGQPSEAGTRGRSSCPAR